MPISTLESLPVELIQPIFILSDHNIALLDVSTLIAAKLSSDHVYNSICNQQLTRVLESRGQQAKTQTRIFASRWMTWSFFQAWVTRTYEEIGCLCGLTPEEGCLDPQWPPDFKDATTLVYSRSHLPELAFVRGRLPKRLLRGPWTQDNVQFLRFLLWTTGMTVDWRNVETREAAIWGRKRAMKECNFEAVELFNHNRRLGRVADMDTLRYAVLEAGCDRSVVYDTVFSMIMWGPQDTYECADLDRWCAKREEEGDSKGKWLRGRLGEMRGSKGSRTLNGMQSDVDDDDGKTGDRLVVQPSIWEKPVTQLGWAYHPTPNSLKTSLHSITRADQEDFWRWTKGKQRFVKGKNRTTTRIHFWLDMWVPVQKARHEGDGSGSDTDNDTPVATEVQT